jgi:hypothetical protein
MNPTDLLYADMRRINTYFYQIGGRTRRLRVTAGVRLSYNPSVELSFKESAYTATQFDKIDAVKGVLKKQALLMKRRPIEGDADVDFVEEECNATKIEIPARRGAAGPSKKITLWACLPELIAEKSGNLILVEDFNYPDEKATSFMAPIQVRSATR